MMRPFLLCLMLPVLALAEPTPKDTPPVDTGLRLERLPDGTRYALIGDPAAKRAPTLFVFQGDIDVARREPIYTEVGRIVAKAGFLAVVIDAPAHGEDHRPGEPAELAGWRTRVDRGDDLVGSFVVRSRTVLDHLVKTGAADPARVAAVGTSRGGFLAFHFAAAEPRVRCVGGIAPVTDLLALREFSDTPAVTAAQSLALATLAPRLAGRPAWLSIGNRDTRVSTESAIAFSRTLVAAAPAGAPAPVTLLVHDGEGHRSTPADHERLAAWLLAQPALRP